MWTDLVQAYESKLGVLEEARAAYAEAITQVINQSAPAMETAVREVTSEHRVDAAVYESGGNAPFPQAPWACITIGDDEVGTEFRIAAWVSSSWGGPGGVLRVALSLERVHSSMDRREWVATCSESIGESVPGQPFEPLDGQRFSDFSPDWPVIRVANVELTNTEARQTASGARSITRSFTESILPLLGSIRDASMAVVLAESALLRYRSVLEPRAQLADEPMYPARGLGPWQGGRFLQAGSFWLATNPETRELLAAAKNDEDAVRSLASRLGRETARRGGRLAVVVLSEEQLRGSVEEIDAAVAHAFDVWFETKSSESGAASADEPE